MQIEGVNIDWADGFNGAITVCNREGIIVYMNDYSIKQFKKYGGKKLLGTNLRPPLKISFFQKVK